MVCYTVDAMKKDLSKITPPEAYRLLALRSALGLEMKGLRHSRGINCHRIIKTEFSLKGSRESVHAAFTKILEEAGILVRTPGGIQGIGVKGLSSKDAIARRELNAAMPGDDQDVRKQEYAEEVEAGQHDGC